MQIKKKRLGKRRKFNDGHWHLLPSSLATTGWAVLCFFICLFLLLIYMLPFLIWCFRFLFMCFISCLKNFPSICMFSFLFAYFFVCVFFLVSLVSLLFAWFLFCLHFFLLAACPLWAIKTSYSSQSGNFTLISSFDTKVLFSFSAQHYSFFKNCTYHLFNNNMVQAQHLSQRVT